VAMLVLVRAAAAALRRFLLFFCQSLLSLYQGFAPIGGGSLSRRSGFVDGPEPAPLSAP
jgi:hypothetical protein